MEMHSFFFLLYYSNPVIERVYIYPDGDEKRLCMRHADFISFLESTLGHQPIPAIKNTLLTHGTFWLLDREHSMLRRVVLKGKDDIKNIQNHIQDGLQKEQKRLHDAKEGKSNNVADKYAGTTINVPTTSEDDAAPPVIIVR